MKKIETYKNKLELYDEKKISLTEMIYIFVTCAFIGWLVEEVYVFFIIGKFVDRGMNYGPFCSIYGFGAIILYLLFYNLKAAKKNIPYTFISTAIVMGTFELLSGLFFKYILNIEMWNYHGKFLEILNYTTVPILIGWGILGTLYIFFLQPLMIRTIELLPKNIAKRLAFLIISIYFLDSVISLTSS